jgi:autotransporter-associated beta strand protein
VEERNTATAHFKTAVSPTTASIQKDGNGTLVLYGQNKWTGFTQIQGTLVFATNNAIDSASAMIFQNNSIFETRGYDGEFSTLDINGAVTFDFGNTNGLSSQLVFADSSDTNVVKWMGTAALDIINFTEGVDSIRIGTDNTGLSEGQVTNITVNGVTAKISYQGYLVGGSPAPLPIGSIDYEKAGVGGDMTLTWSTHEFQNYDIEYKNSLIFDSWQFYTNVVGIGGTNMMSIMLPAVQDEEFYRIISN